MNIATSPEAISGEFPIPAGVNAEKVVSVTHYTDRLFSFRTTRTQSFRFRSGEFAMIGLPNAAKPVYRAYSMASPSWDEELEFFSIKVPNGPLTEHLQKIKPGDTVLIRPKTTGTLVLDALKPGKRLWMLSTGTGIAPFASLVRDPETYEKYEKVILTHTCRLNAELEYGNQLAKQIAEDPLIREFVDGRFVHYTTTTRDQSERMGRITDKIRDGSLFADLGVEAFNPEDDRIMICGSIEMTKELKEIAESYGMTEGANNAPGEFVIERAFVG